jgi:hypothetical protein
MFAEENRFILKHGVGILLSERETKKRVYLHVELFREVSFVLKLSGYNLELMSSLVSVSSTDQAGLKGENG